MAKDDHKLTADEAWQLIEPKLESYLKTETWKLVEPFWKAAKIGAVVISSLLGLVVTVLGATAGMILGIDAVKDGLVRTVFKIETQLGRQEARDILKAEFKKYLLEEEARGLVKAEFKKYLLENDEPTSLFESNSKAPLRIKGEQILDAKMNEKFSGEIKNVRVKYAFGASFSLSNEPAGKAYNLKFVKPTGSTAEVDCDAVYPEKTTRNAVFLKLNDLEEGVGRVDPKQDSFIGAGGAKLLEEDNTKYFSDKSRVRDIHNLIFQVDDTHAFSGSIQLRCTIAVISPASRLARGR